MPDCDKCIPPLLPGNEKIANVYLAVRGQVITAGPQGIVVDINYQSLDIVMDMYEIEDKKDCFERVVGLFRTMLAEERNTIPQGVD